MNTNAKMTTSGTTKIFSNGSIDNSDNDGNDK